MAVARFSKSASPWFEVGRLINSVSRARKWWAFSISRSRSSSSYSDGQTTMIASSVVCSAHAAALLHRRNAFFRRTSPSFSADLDEGKHQQWLLPIDVVNRIPSSVGVLSKLILSSQTESATGVASSILSYADIWYRESFRNTFWGVTSREEKTSKRWWQQWIFQVLPRSLRFQQDQCHQRIVRDNAMH